MSRTYDEVVKDLASDIPRSDVALRDGGSGKKLSYLEGWKVIHLLNEIIGVGNWAYSHELTKTYEGEVNDKFYTSYLAKVRLAVTIGGVPTEFTEVGFGDGTDARNPGKTHELAAKEAVTDGLKRCAKNLGMRLGLALYDKTQENVSDDAQDTKQERPVGAARAAPAPVRAAAVPKAAPSVQSAVSAGPSEGKSEKDTLIQIVGAKSRIVITKKRATVEDLVGYMNEKFGATKKEELSEPSAKEMITYLDNLLT